MSSAGIEAASCMSYLEQLLSNELKQAQPCVERLSIALGLVELALTPRDASKRAWPTDLPTAVDQLAAAFDGFVAELAVSPALNAARPGAEAAPSAAAKVKAVADAVWSRLNKGSYSKDLLHAQHVYNFAALLLPGGPPAGLKKQLDCAGVVTTTFAICQALALRHPQHADLAAARMQISEDHCWVQLDASGARGGTVEVTTDTAAKRGLPVAPDAWAGWLYTGGHAVLCSPHQALAALVTSLNPAVTGGKKGVDSEQLQAVQQRLLEVLLQERPDALYPAALCALADLKEVAAQDALDEARDSGDAARVVALLQRQPGDSQDLFEQARHLASNGSSSIGSGGSGDGRGAGVGSNAGMEVKRENGTSPVSSDGTGAAATDGVAAEHQAAAAAAAAAGAAASCAASTPAACDDSTHSACTATGTDGSGGSGAGHQWYVYSYLAAYLARRAEFLGSCHEAGLLPAAPATADAADGDAAAAVEAPAEQHPEQQHGQGQEGLANGSTARPSYWDLAVATYHQALQVAAQGGAVLAKYRYLPATDEQLFKDVEGVLEEVVRDGLAALAKRGPGGQLHEATLLQPVLLLWDGVCWLFSGKAKPGGWVGLVMKVAKLFTPESREAAAAGITGRVISGPMLAAQPLWRDLKPVPLRPIFESADVGAANGGAAESGGSERAAKRARR